MLGLVALGTVSACGFRPAYGPGGAAAGLFGRISLADPGSRDGLTLNNRLIQRLVTATAPLWRLEYDLETSQQVFSASGTGRTQLNGRLQYRLVPLAEDQSMALRGAVSAFSAYDEGQTSASNTNVLVSNVAAAADARNRLLVQLADRLVEDLIAQSAGAGR